MAYEFVLTSRAQRELDRVPRDVFQSLAAAIHALRDNPRPHGVQKLEDDLHRLRVGDWRFLYLIRDKEQRVVIIRVARRSEKTYKFLR